MVKSRRQGPIGTPLSLVRSFDSLYIALPELPDVWFLLLTTTPEMASCFLWKSKGVKRSCIYPYRRDRGEGTGYSSNHGKQSKQNRKQKQKSYLVSSLFCICLSVCTFPALIFHAGLGQQEDKCFGRGRGKCMAALGQNRYRQLFWDSAHSHWYILHNYCPPPKLPGNVLNSCNRWQNNANGLS